MKINFKGLRDPDSFPLPKQIVFEGKELEEIHRRMKEYLRKNTRMKVEE